MKKAIKLLLSSLLVMLMFSCIIIDEYREVEVYNSTGYIFTDVYVIPAVEFPNPYQFNNSIEVAYECDTFFQQYEQTGFGSQYDRSYTYVDLNDINIFENKFVIVAIDTDGDAYYKNFDDSYTYVNMKFSDHMGNNYFY